MIVVDQKPSLEDALVHYGVKGMKWGKRKRSPAEEAERSRRFKKNAKRTAAVVVVGGAALTVAILAKNGKLPVKSLSGSGKKAKATAEAIERGKRLSREIAINDFKTKAALLSKDIAEANAEQDAFMRSIGLGAVVNNSKIK